MERNTSRPSMRAAMFGIGLLLLLAMAAPALAAQSRLPIYIDLYLGDQDVTFYGADGWQKNFYGDAFGYDLAVGDFDGDGISDILVGAGTSESLSNSRGAGVGEAYLFFGRTSWPELFDACTADNCEAATPRLQGSEVPDVIIFGRELGIGYPDMLGETVWTGDIDGDGFDDIIAPAALGDGPENARRDSGEVYVLFGRPRNEWPDRIDLLQDEQDIVVFGADPDDFLYAADAADIDGDGVDDLLLRSGEADGAQDLRAGSGEVYILFGRSRSLWNAVYDVKGVAGPPPDIFILGADAGDCLGSGMGAADVNGDGIEDLILAASGGDGPDEDRPDAGEVYILPGRDRSSWPPTAIDLDLATSATSETTVIYGSDANACSKFGLRVTTADVNADNLSDLLLAFDQGYSDRYGEFFFGRKTWPSTIDLGTELPDISFGWPVPIDLMLCGDINGDGKVDLIGNEFGSGLVRVFCYWKHEEEYPPAPPPPGGLNPDYVSVWLASGYVPEDIVVNEAIFGDGLATAVACADVDGDGHDDLVISARVADVPDGSRIDMGAVYVILGPL